MTVTTTTVTKDFEFIEGALVHYGNGEWLALCGTGWLNMSNDPEQVTCPDCKQALHEQEAS